MSGGCLYDHRELGPGDRTRAVGVEGGEGGEGYLLAIIEISTVQSSAQTYIRNVILFIDTSNNV